MATVGAPSSFRQPSRKGKKSWRKNIDLTPVTTGLETLREEQIQFGSPLVEKSDGALFSVDLGGSSGVERKEFGKFHKRLRADEILAARSAIPAVAARKRAGESRIGSGIVEKIRRRKDGISYKEIQRLRKIAFAQGQAEVEAKEGEELYDPWDETTTTTEVDAAADEFSFLEKSKPVKPPSTLKHAPINLALAVKAVPAVRLPEPGTSYNPEFEKWNALVQAEGEKEVVAERKRLVEAVEEERLRELAAMSDPEPPSDEDEDGELRDMARGEEGVEVATAKVEIKRKTQAQKNKEKRQKELERARAEARKQKLRERELFLIKKYAKDAKTREKLRMAKLIAKKMALKDDERNPKILRKRRLGKIPLPEPRLELQLADELAESLRQLKPEGNLLSDRFRSLRERGILETRAPIIQPKKAKRFMTEKWSYKDFK